MAYSGMVNLVEDREDMKADLNLYGEAVKQANTAA